MKRIQLECSLRKLFRSHILSPEVKSLNVNIHDLI